MSEITTTAIALSEEAKEIVAQSWPTITNPGEYDQAAAARKHAKEQLKAIAEERKKITTPMDAAKKAIMDWFRGPTDALEKFISDVGRPMVAYVTEEQAKARQAAAEAAAVAKAEKDRIEAEQRKLAEEMEALGEVELAAKLKAAPVVVETAPTAQAPKAVGTSTRTVVDFEVVDMSALLAFCAGNPSAARIAEINIAEVKRWHSVWGDVPPGVKMSERIVMVNR